MILFWEGTRRKMENPGFYFHLEPDSLMLAGGMHTFQREVLHAYRDAVVDPILGQSLVDAVERVSGAGRYEIGGLHYKRVPRGYDEDHPNAEFLRYSGLYASVRTGLPDELHSRSLVDYCFDRFADLDPIHRWEVELLSSM